MIIDEVYYDNGETFPDENGKSMMLLAPTLNNSLGENWATADVVFGAGDFGTPNEANYSGNCGDSSGDMNGDGAYNVLDVVSLVNCVLANNCEDNVCDGDMNDDGAYDILDIVSLINCILSNSCNK